MKTTQKLLIAIILGLFTFASCSKDDDNNDDQQQHQQTTQQLLTSGKWYFESKSTGTYTACEKKGYIQFMTDGSMIINSFDDGSGTCESLGAASATYTLTNNVNLTLVFGSDTQSAVINSISESELTTTNSDTGEINVFDKTEG